MFGELTAGAKPQIQSRKLTATVSAYFMASSESWPGTWLVLILWELFGKSVSGGRGLSTGPLGALVLGRGRLGAQLAVAFDRPQPLRAQ